MRALLLLVVVILVGVPVAWLDAAPVPKDFGDTFEVFEWKGENRKRTVRKLNCGTTTVEFVKLPKGSFQMGSDKKKQESAQDDEIPAHQVTFTKDLWVSKYPVTKGQFGAFVKAKNYQTEAETDGEGGHGFNGKELEGRNKKYTWKETGWEQSEKHPVVNVTWNDAAAFCDWISKENSLKSGFVNAKGKWDLPDSPLPVGIRLLTEAEYEYASRGGSDTAYLTGDRLESLEGYANIADKSVKAKFAQFESEDINDGEVFTSPVGKYKPNGFGLYDMTGNVWSWCADWYGTYTAEAVINPSGPKNGSNRLYRGGSWSNRSCRVAFRVWNSPDYRFSNLGFRVCVTLD